MARPKKEISEKQVFELAQINCSYAEMAAVLDCSEDTITRRFADVIKKGRENGRMSLKRMQFTKAMEGNITMLIWLGKQLLGQTDKVEQRTELSATANVKVEETKAIVEEFRTLLSNSANERATQ